MRGEGEEGRRNDINNEYLKLYFLKRLTIRFLLYVQSGHQRTRENTKKSSQNTFMRNCNRKKRNRETATNHVNGNGLIAWICTDLIECIKKDIHISLVVIFWASFCYFFLLQLCERLCHFAIGNVSLFLC